MTFSFRPASRESTKLLIGLCGPSGSGKTLSALRLASGLAGGGRVALIDTEQGRACQYAPQPGTAAATPGSFSFDHGLLAAPFSPRRYAEVLAAAAALKPDVIIVDSMSHEWEGPGGILDTVDAAREKSGAANNFSVWAKPKQEHQKLVGALLQTPAHVILCLRAKEKRGLVPDPKRPGKMEIVNLGWHPICESGLTYELTLCVLLGTDRKGVPIVDGFDFGKLPINMTSLLPADRQITEATGAALRAWATGEPKQPETVVTPSADPFPPSELPDDPLAPVFDALRPSAERGYDALERHFRSLTKAVQQKLSGHPQMLAMKNLAAERDFERNPINAGE